MSNIHPRGEDVDHGAFAKILGKTQPRAQRLQFEQEDNVKGVDDSEESKESCDSWCMIQVDSDTLNNVLIDLGTSGVQVEEIISLDDDDSQQQITPIFGLILLFKWQELDSSVGNLVKDSRLDQIFFARQIIPNTCPIQALVSIVLNCTDKVVQLGQILNKYKKLTEDYDAQERGLTLSMNDQIRGIHNNFASQQLPGFDLPYKHKGKDAFHCVSYIPFKGHLYELDGLQLAPIDHAAIPEGIEWTDLARSIIKQRIQRYSQGEIQFSLMAVVSNLRKKYERELEEVLADSELTDDERNAKASNLNTLIQEEKRKRESYRIDKLREKRN